MLSHLDDKELFGIGLLTVQLSKFNSCYINGDDVTNQTDLKKARLLMPKELLDTV